MRKQFVLLTITLLAVPSLMAFNPQPEPPGFGAVGIVSSQTARINVYFGPPPQRATGPCAGIVQLRFYDQAGSILAQRTAQISPTALESLEFTPPRDTSAAGRMQVRADVSWITFPPGPCRGGSLVGNVEVYSNVTGQTQFVLPGMIQGFQEVNSQQ